jgi:hypothetical protein
LDAIHHDYMFVNIIFTKYISACIHQGLNPRPCGSTLGSLPLNRFNTLTRRKKLALLCLAWNYLGDSNFNNVFLFLNLFKCYKWNQDLETCSIMYSNNNNNSKKIKRYFKKKLHVMKKFTNLFKIKIDLE